MNEIFEDRFLLEEGVYWRYMTDEKRKIDRKEPFRQVRAEAKFTLIMPNAEKWRMEYERKR